MDDPKAVNRVASGPQQLLRAAQVVTLALVTGVMMFAGVATFMAMNRASGSPAGQDQMLWIILVPTAVIATAGVFLVPMMFRKQAAQTWQGRSDNEAALAKVVRTFQMACVLRAALLEMPALMGSVIVLITGNLYGLLAPGIAVIVMLILFPRTAMLQDWLDEATGSEFEKR